MALSLLSELDGVLKDLIEIGIWVWSGWKLRKLKMIETVHFRFA